ncbi:caspase-7 (C14 family), partial [Reticulomyxa filosa]
MIAISEYTNNDEWSNLESAKDTDINNFKSIFGQELNYEFVYNKEPKMNKEDVQEFIDDVFTNFKLRRNLNKYDALIMIISGHGDEGDVLVSSDGKYLPIDKIRSSFNSHEIESLKDCPKIFIIDVCRGDNISQ